jgi:hypothetical protein
MTLLALVLLLGVLVGLIAFTRRAPRAEIPTDPEAALRAAIELHRIGRKLDGAWLKSQQRQDATRLRRDIGEALDDDAL